MLIFLKDLIGLVLGCFSNASNLTSFIASQITSTAYGHVEIPIPVRSPNLSNAGPSQPRWVTAR